MTSTHRSTRTRATLAIAALCLLALIVIAIILLGPNGASRTLQITFFLPEDYVGPFTVHHTPAGGIPRISGRQVFIDIPPEGQVALSDVHWINEWHQARAEYPSGRVIPAYGLHEPSNDLVLFEEGATSDGVYRFRIGSVPRDQPGRTHNSDTNPARQP